MEPTTLGARLKQLMGKYGINESELAKRSDVPQPSVNRIVNDKIKSPKYENVERLAKTLGVRAEYLMHGYPSPDDVTAGEKPSTTAGQTKAAIPPTVGASSEASLSFLPPMEKDGSIGGVVDNALAEKRLTQNNLDSSVYIYPELSWSDTTNLKKLRDPDFFHKKSHAYSSHKTTGLGFWLSMRGDAMSAPVGMTPTLPEGTQVLFDTGRRVKHGRLVLVLLEDRNTAICRLFVEEGGQRFLKALNPIYPLITLSDTTTFIACALELRFPL